MTQDEHAAFRRFLESGRYRPQTVALYAGAARRLIRDGARPEREFELAALLRFAEFLEEREEAERATKLHEIVARARGARPGGKVAKKRDAQERKAKRSGSYPDSEWLRLTEALAADPSPSARAVELMQATGLRVGDVLAIRRETISEAVRTAAPVRIETKGGKIRLLPLTAEWHALWATWLVEEKKARLTAAEAATWWPNVAAMLTRTPGGSRSADGREHAGYKQMARALARASAAAGVSARSHTHRIRTTFAVQAIRITGDISMVQQALGHENIATTSRYVDEARPDDLAKLQEKVAAMRRS